MGKNIMILSIMIKEIGRLGLVLFFFYLIAMLVGTFLSYDLIGYRDYNLWGQLLDLVELTTGDLFFEKYSSRSG